MKTYWYKNLLCGASNTFIHLTLASVLRILHRQDQRHFPNQLCARDLGELYGDHCKSVSCLGWTAVWCWPLAYEYKVYWPLKSPAFLRARGNMQVHCECPWLNYIKSLVCSIVRLNGLIWATYTGSPGSSTSSTSVLMIFSFSKFKGTYLGGWSCSFK